MSRTLEAKQRNKREKEEHGKLSRSKKFYDEFKPERTETSDKNVFSPKPPSLH